MFFKFYKLELNISINTLNNIQVFFSNFLMFTIVHGGFTQHFLALFIRHFILIDLKQMSDTI